jgi:hypothetical protein
MQSAKCKVQNNFAFFNMFIFIFISCGASEKSQDNDGADGEIYEIVIKKDANEASEIQEDVFEEAVMIKCPVEGEPCDDKIPCTYGEKCKGGECKGGIPYICDDGRECTKDSCDGKGNCMFEIKTGTCLASGVCYNEGGHSLMFSCHVCDLWFSSTELQILKDGAECDSPEIPDQCKDASAGHCKEGHCMPDVLNPKNCNDNNPCTTDSCDPVEGCMNVSQNGIACPLAGMCKTGICKDSECKVEKEVCDDGNPCTEDVCNEYSNCEFKPVSFIECDDGNLCTMEDRCGNGICKGTVKNCEDGNVCTTDQCDPVSGCFHDMTGNACCDEKGQSKCDDGDVCTDDLCTGTGENLQCFHQPNSAVCDDSDSCTVNDHCFNGFCTGTDKDCGDGNSCTEDSCIAGQCKHVSLPDDSLCDDGLACSTGDKCKKGKCTAKMFACCGISDNIIKISKLYTYATGYKGQGFNLDEKNSTCSPADKCSDGIDNNLGPVGSLGNTSVDASLKSGQLVLLFEMKNLKTNGENFSMTAYSGWFPNSPPCNPVDGSQICNYYVLASSFNLQGACIPVIDVDNAKITQQNGKLHLAAGGKNYSFYYNYPLMGSITINVSLYFSRIEADVTVENGKIVKMENGILGGAIPKQQLLDGINAIPEEQESQLPLPKDQIVSLVDAIIIPDIDGNNDGTPESASIGITFSGIRGKVVGMVGD